MAEMRVLLVDDEPELVFTLAERLELRGFEVDAVTTANDALQHLGENTYDIAVVDLKMPLLDGIEFLDLVRRRGLDLPVIFMTGHGGMEEGEQGLSEGACACLFKPVSLGELIAAMRAGVRRKDG
jgi:DNA-binding response OmpR family regulator